MAVEVSDAELVASVRAGDEHAYEVLYRRHRRAALRFAQALAGRSGDAEDLVADAFTRVLAALTSGHGPNEAFRPYLLAAVRSVFYTEARRSTRERPTGEVTELVPDEPFDDPVLAGDERRLIATAFSSLPERWQVVLWHTAVEGEKPAKVARLLGISANAVAALAYRAREGLREGYLRAHLGSTADERCHATVAQLVAYTRRRLSPTGASGVRRHLAGCARCRLLFTDLADVNSRLGSVVAPVVLGAAAAGYLVSAGASGAGAALVGRLLQDSHAAAVTAAAGISAVVLTVGGSTPVPSPRPALPPGVSAEAVVPPPVGAQPSPGTTSAINPPTSSTPGSAPPGPPRGSGVTPSKVPPAAPLSPGVRLHLAGLGRGRPGVIVLHVTHPIIGPHAEDVEVTAALTLPAGITLHTTEAGHGWTCAMDGDGITCHRAGLSPGPVTVVNIHVRVDNDAASGTVSASVSWPGSAPVTAMAQTPFGPLPQP